MFYAIFDWVEKNCRSRLRGRISRAIEGMIFSTRTGILSIFLGDCCWKERNNGEIERRFKWNAIASEMKWFIPIKEFRVNDCSNVYHLLLAKWLFYASGISVSVFIAVWGRLVSQNRDWKIKGSKKFVRGPWPISIVVARGDFLREPLIYDAASSRKGPRGLINAIIQTFFRCRKK